MTVPARRLRRSAAEPARTAEPVVWAIALAGGEGTRLAAYIERRFGRRIPKQYCALLGTRSMLEHTLDRLAALAPPARTLAVIAPGHAALAAPQLAGRCDHVLSQPAPRGTGVAVYAALATIARWAPHALVVITPSDHYVDPGARYVEQLHAALGLAARHPEEVVLIGVRPTEPDPDFGYLVPGAAIGRRAARVAGFVEKPAPEAAAALCARGALWNTMVVCGRIDALWRLGRATRPDLIEPLDAVIPRIGTPGEDAALAAIYRAPGEVCFSRDVTEAAPERLLVLELIGVEWSDWGRAERVEAVLARRGAGASARGASPAPEPRSRTRSRGPAGW